MRRDADRIPRVLIANCHEPLIRDSAQPISVGIDSECAGTVQKTEYIRVSGAHALQPKAAVDLVIASDGSVETRLQSILVRSTDDRNFVVVARIPGNIRQWEQLQQRCGLWADPVQR